MNTTFMVNCPVVGHEEEIVFNIVEITNLIDTQKEGKIGRMCSCSYQRKTGSINICNNCPFPNELTDMPITL